MRYFDNDSDIAHYRSYPFSRPRAFFGFYFRFFILSNGNTEHTRINRSAAVTKRLTPARPLYETSRPEIPNVKSVQKLWSSSPPPPPHTVLLTNFAPPRRHRHRHRQMLVYVPFFGIRKTDNGHLSVWPQQWTAIIITVSCTCVCVCDFFLFRFYWLRVTLHTAQRQTKHLRAHTSDRRENIYKKKSNTTRR